MSIKISSDTIRNRTRDLLACSTVPQPTAPTRAPRPSIPFSIRRSLIILSTTLHVGATNSLVNL